MTVKTDDGGPAFPLAAHAFPYEREHDDIEPTHLGMTLRDYFAGQAMTAIGRTYVVSGEDDMLGKPSFNEEARRCYEWADAMLAARAK
jgi:hypothetical protein